MVEQSRTELHVAMVGPSRVGKTSLLTALMVAGEEYFEGKRVTVEPADSATRRAFSNSDDQMTGELQAGVFKPNSLPGGSTHVEYRLLVQVIEGPGLTIVFHDFPGGWIENDQRSKIQQVLQESDVVIVPVDATTLMEAGPLHRGDARRRLQLTNVRQLVRGWAKARLGEKSNATLIICPVKCETYFADNGGRFNREDELFDLVGATYQEVVGAAREEYLNGRPRASVHYMPVDTIGPVELVQAKWIEGETIDAEYRVRIASSGRPATRKVKGAEPILAKLVNSSLDLQRRELSWKRDRVEEDLQALRDEYGSRRVKTRIMDRLKRRRGAKLAAIESRKDELAAAADMLARFGADVAMEPSRSDAGRVRAL